MKTTLMHTPGSKNITEQNNAVMKQEFVNREAWQDYSHLLSLDLALKLRWLSVFLIASCRFYVQLVTNQAALHVLSEPLDYTREKQLQLLFLAREKAGKTSFPRQRKTKIQRLDWKIVVFSPNVLEKKRFTSGRISNSIVTDVFTGLHKYHSASTTQEPLHLFKQSCNALR